ncbi:MAG: hypothetical protein K8R90_00675 [Candidatus Cloacimonetes bacterium]|nr:hypothetical protein [Candidatus Cloacimonadota bacterium]
MKTLQSRLPIGVVIAETVLLIIGVFLGIFVNEMRIEQRDKARAQVALGQIRAELQSNQEMINAISAHHVAVRDSLNSLLSRTTEIGKSPTLKDLWKSMNGGFGVPNLQQHSWSLALHLGVLEHIDYPTARLLSNVYSLQEFYIDKYDRLADNLYLASNIDPEFSDGLVLAMGFLANDIVIHEQDIIEAYTKTLEYLDSLQ